MSNFNKTGRRRSAVFNVTRETEPNELVEITPDSQNANIIDATIGETKFRIEILHLNKRTDEPGVPNHLYSTVNGVPREFTLSKAADGRTHVLADGYSSNFAVQPGTKRAPSMLQPGKPGQKSPLITSPMPATVLEVLVEVGSHVRFNQPVMRVEAMKMITTLTAPVAGIVREITVAERQTVAAGQTLARVEE
ncbi:MULTISPECIES: acetyl-CoA carboxylase biotin carboxyl carrier protein subunit [Burkholderia]|uniref:acetyl-CoA carboxylase biotin carboxyl carrier protein subunit n=1 Tax=Burkholderia TaxID=32008 RepID=UPI00158E1A04|nr:acetyl-CoA carboxylase biotin carboxyl carrier protein subunit [Burkholderia ambifaria]